MRARAMTARRVAGIKTGNLRAGNNNTWKYMTATGQPSILTYLKPTAGPVCKDRLLAAVADLRAVREGRSGGAALLERKLDVKCAWCGAIHATKMQLVDCMEDEETTYAAAFSLKDSSFDRKMKSIRKRYFRTRVDMRQYYLPDRS